MRVGGVQPLQALRGFETWSIVLLFRWGSVAVLGYVRDTPLLLSAGWARMAAERRAPKRLLRQARKQILAGLGHLTQIL